MFNFQLYCFQININELEKENAGLVEKLENKSIMLSDAEMKISLITKNCGNITDKNSQFQLKTASDRFTVQVETLQQQLDTLNKKLQTKEFEFKQLQEQHRNLVRSVDAITSEKNDIVNQLSSVTQEKIDLNNDNLTKNEEIHNLKETVKR